MSVPLVPAPVYVVVGSGSFELTSGEVVVPPQLARIAQLFADEVARESGICLTVTSSDSASSVITVEMSSEGLDAVASSSGNRADGSAEADERYGLVITTEGVRVWAATPEGVFRGLTSLRQLIAAGASDGVATLPVIEVVDGPRYAWRGLSFDVVRTFHGPETVRRVIDMLAAHKLNVLHLHLTDDQGWRIEVPSRPALTEVGSIGAIGDRPGGFYTVEEMAELVKYAADRFITIVPEIDMPGHTGAIFRSYPELAPTKGFSGDIAPGLAVGTLDPGRPETWEFVGDVLDGVIPQFPNAAYIHVGGDEAFGMPVEEHAAFMERATQMVRDRGRLAVVWQEAARGNLSSQDVVQYWMDARDTGAMLANEALTSMVPEEVLGVLKETLSHVAQDVPRALEMGTKLIVSPTSRLYFDRPQGDASRNASQEEMRQRVGLPVYPPLSLREGVEWDPIEDTPDLVSDGQVAGMEAAIWCETITDRDELEFLLLPRLGGLAEKAWGVKGATGWGDYADRLGAQAALWNSRGWNWYEDDSVEWSEPLRDAGEEH